MFIVESVEEANKPGKESKWKIKQMNSVVFFFILLRYWPLTPGLGDVLESLEETSNMKNNIAAYDSKMIGKYNLSVKRKLGAVHAKFVLTP
jgi:hypothetical protein